MTKKSVHIVGAGLAGLSAAVALLGCGRHIFLYESAPQAGGRCRSFYDHSLGRHLDNGNHLMMSANRAALGYLDRIGARDTVIEAAEAAYPFVDLDSAEHWVLRPNRGPLPWWVLVPSRRVPGSRLADYGSALRLLRAPPDATVADCVPPAHPLYRRFWEPLTLAALNCGPREAAAAPLRAVLLETFARGADFCRPLVARDGLGNSLVTPALDLLAQKGIRPFFGQRLRELRLGGQRVTGLNFGTHIETVAADDAVVLALPPAVAAGLLPDLTLPEDGHVIVNGHFRLDRPPPPLPLGLPFLGVIGGDAHWIFLRDDVISVTVSGAGILAERPAEDIAERLWHDVTRALDLEGVSLPPHRIIKEKRATFIQTPANQRRRPPAVTRWSNLLLAGDWTATGLPCTIEGAIRSGNAAAAAALGENARAA
ncbi:MAG: hydroxysqualene dehydroxylase HpnE [Rhodospirillaceae bacterium]